MMKTALMSFVLVVTSLQAWSDEGKPCNRNSDCDQSEYCFNDICRETKDVSDVTLLSIDAAEDALLADVRKDCKTDIDCGYKEICRLMDHKCKRVECTSNMHCKRHERCSFNRCRPRH